jgi:hypothetical protein
VARKVRPLAGTVPSANSSGGPQPQQWLPLPLLLLLLLLPPLLLLLPPLLPLLLPPLPPTASRAGLNGHSCCRSAPRGAEPLSSFSASVGSRS